MSSRSHYLPSVSVLAKMSDSNIGAVLEYHLSQIEGEISGIKSGYITVDHKGRAHYLRLARARMRHLENVAQSFGFWLDDKKAA